MVCINPNRVTMNEEEFQDLLLKYQQGICTADEKAMLEDWVTFGQFNGKTLSDEEMEVRLSKVAVELPLSIPIAKVKLWPKVITAAAVALLVVGAGLFYFSNQQVTNKNTEHILGGKNGATLILADGRKIRLTDAANGELVNAAGISISKTADGQLVYEMKGNSGSGTEINTLITARGETYQVRLSDGSLVVLNSASSLTFSAALNEQGLRKATLNGEAYFEIAKDKKHPFVVKTNNQEVEVLGTHFNINSYIEEGETKTTLLEGSVKVSGISGSRILKPGQQADLSIKGISVRNVEVEDAVAWKNGYFMFNSERLESIMNRISRWYNVELSYEDPSLKKETFFGRVSRSENIEKVLNTLEGTEVLKFEVEGNLIKIKRK